MMPSVIRAQLFKAAPFAWDFLGYPVELEYT